MLGDFKRICNVVLRLDDLRLAELLVCEFLANNIIKIVID